MESLFNRQKSCDIFSLYKILHSLVDTPELLQNIQITFPLLGSGLCNRKRFPLHRCRTNTGRHAPMYRMIALYSGISSNLDIYLCSSASAYNRKPLKPTTTLCQYYIFFQKFLFLIF